ncbi:hypothetical protein ACWGB8_06425 [Kitasatospora sp. NPDC054939]
MFRSGRTGIRTVCQSGPRPSPGPGHLLTIPHPARRPLPAFWDERVARHTVELADDPDRRALLADTVDVVTSGLMSLSFEDPAWDEQRPRTLLTALLRPALG